MAIFDFTFPGTEAQALYIEDALHAVHRRCYGEDKDDESTRFPWLANFDARALMEHFCLEDVAVSHDAGRMEIRVSPGGDEDDMDYDPRDLEMGAEAVAVALMMMKAHFGVSTPTAFTFLVQKQPETILQMSVAGGGTVAVSRHRIHMETFAQTADRLANLVTA